MPRHTTIVVNHERWKVPWGFGALYLERVKDEKRTAEAGCAEEALSTLQTVLLLVGYDTSTATLAAWPLRKRTEAFVYAIREHLVASDNPLQRHPPLDWLPDPWKGPGKGQGVFYGPSPTVLT